MVPEHSSSKNKKAVLLLEDCTFSIGYRFGAPVKVSSEVMFSTFMVSYAEALADLAYIEWILTLTYPFMDDYAVAGHDAHSEIPFHFEPNRIQVTVLTTNGVGMKPYFGVSAITVDKWSTNSATLNERGCV